MRHEDCKNWDYDTHPQVQSVADACLAITAGLLANGNSHDACIQDTRSHHLEMFKRVVPGQCVELAGNYRRALYPCLAAYAVYFGKHPGMHEGEPPANVDVKMAEFHAILAGALAKHDLAIADAKTPGQKAALLARLVALVAATLTHFYDIHPYANGNGHIGRLLAWVLLSRFGYPPNKLSLHKSPKGAVGYYDLFDHYRAKKKTPLHTFLLTAVLP